MALAASLLISTYNWPWALERVLWSVFAQSRHDFEIVIADDGSKPETSALIARMAQLSPVPITHVWQPDEGFGKCRALNKALAVSRGKRIIVTDGDCVLRRDFVDTHIKQARPGTFLAGSYFKLPDSVSQSVDQASIANQQVFTPKWLVEHGMSSSPRLWAKVGAPRPLAWLLDRLSNARPSWNGHSASCSRLEALQVNGFNEEMGYGGLDVEFGLRLNHIGLKARRIRFSTVALHLHHERGYATTEMREKSERVKERTRSEGLAWAEIGIDQWLGPDGDPKHAPEDRISSLI
jgi:glycosyltransferase involved in cell wall biosynthesis